jgi:hypothetical protein
LELLVHGRVGREERGGEVWKTQIMGRPLERGRGGEGEGACREDGSWQSRSREGQGQLSLFFEV